MRESVVEKAFVKRIKALGGDVRKCQWVGRRGAPDRLVLLSHEVGLRLSRTPTHFNTSFAWQHPFVELKRQGLEAEDHQAREHVRLRAAGFIVLVIDTLEAIDLYFPLS